MSLEEFANYACEELPHGWSLDLYMENGSGDFELISPDGVVDSEEYCSVDDSLLHRGQLAIAYARLRAAETEKGIIRNG